MDPFDQILQYVASFFTVYMFHLRLKRNLILQLTQIRYLHLISSVSPPSSPWFWNFCDILIAVYCKFSQFCGIFGEIIE